MEDGVERISSNDLSIRMKVTASQIRQDLNNFGGFGQQGYGYNVKYLYTEIAKILGIDRQHNLVIIGAGNLGQAIANYANFERRGFIIKGMFDTNPRLIGLVVRGIEIRGVEDLEQFIVDNDVPVSYTHLIGGVVWDFAREKLESGELFELKFLRGMPEREFCIVTDKRNPMSPAGRRLLGMMIEHEEC